MSNHEHLSTASERPHSAARRSNLIWREKRWQAPESLHQRSLLIYVARGALHCEAGNSIWIAPPTTVLWLPGGTEHNAYAYGDYESYAVWVDDCPGMPSTCCVAPVTPLLRELLLRASGFPEKHAAGSQEERIVRTLIGEIALLPWQNLCLPMPNNPRLRAVAEAMVADPSVRVSSADLARRFGFSERTMSRTFIQDLGMSWGSWRRQLLVTLALLRMANGSSVEAVALSLGYSSSSFIAMFRKTLGKAPGQYLAERFRKPM